MTHRYVNKLQLHLSWNGSTYYVLCPQLISAHIYMEEVCTETSMPCTTQNPLNFHDIHQENFDHSDRNGGFFPEFTRSSLEFSQFANNLAAFGSNFKVSQALPVWSPMPQAQR
ncbi:hypothetical protein OPV22_003329 [Ensete ventricosum]|uniref:Uncharacterized protein n=1 Tax=Ensete ventricosum TaxID=4639 RepID=A0AAV8S0B6_ENSVE|nr:hypothetical protein OPV22_003329 [Ensete ventricosum]